MTKRSLGRALVILFLLSSACQSASVTAPDASVPGWAVISGTIGGASFVAADAYSEPDTAGSLFSPTSTASVLIWNRVAACGPYDKLKNAQALTFDFSLAATGQNPQPIDAPGVFPVAAAGSSGRSVIATYVAFGAGCDLQTILGATSGTVTLTRVTASDFCGSFAITLSTGDVVTGSFDAPNCSPGIPPPSDAGRVCN